MKKETAHHHNIKIGDRIYIKSMVEGEKKRKYCIKTGWKVVGIYTHHIHCERVVGRGHVISECFSSYDLMNSLGYVN